MTGAALLNRRELMRAAAAGLVLRCSRAQSPPPKLRKIDIHVHLGRNQAEMRSLTKDKLPDAVKYLVGQMDENGVARSMVVAVEPVFPTELYLEAVKLAPERLLAACSVMPRPLDAAIDKLKDYHRRGARALKLQPAQYDPHDPAVERLVYEAVKTRMPVLFHHTDTPRDFVPMLTHLASTFADGDFVVIHFGGVYGFNDVLPLARMSNVYLETSTAFPRIMKSPMRANLQFLVDEGRLDRLVFGSELPGDYPAVFAAINDLLGSSAAPELVNTVYRGNADRLLRITISSRLRREEEERDKTDKPGEVLKALGAQPGAHLAEIGCGDGYWVVRMAKAVGPSGKVLGEDISADAVKRLKTRASEDELANIDAVRGEEDDPGFPRQSLDAVLICNTYHEIFGYPAVLRHIQDALKPGGRLVIVDMIARNPEERKRDRAKLAYEHQIAPEMVERELAQAGFVIADKRDPLIDSQEGRLHFMIVGRKG